MEDCKLTFTHDVLSQLLIAAIICGQLNPEESPKVVLRDLINELNELEVNNG